MIVYTLKCDKSHEFEEWFSSSSAFDRQAEAGEVACPVCGSTHVAKAPMAPAVSGGKSSARDAGSCPVAESLGGMPPCAGACGGGCFPR